MVLDYSPSVRQTENTPSLLFNKKHSRKGQSSIYHHHQPFKVAHQKIAIDVDLAHCGIEGYTELTVIPTDPTNRIIKLDARYMNIKHVFVNDRKVNFLYNDHLQLENGRILDALDISNYYNGKGENSSGSSSSNDNAHNNGTIHDFTIFQHHLYKEKLKHLFNGTNTKELAIFLPDKMKITLHEAGSFNALTPIMRDSPGSYKTPNNSEMIYTPITIRVEYSCKNPKDGVNFVGGLHNLTRGVPKSKWHAYTANSLIGVSTSSWVPCVDNLWERSTWQLDISAPRTIGDIVVTNTSTNTSTTTAAAAATAATASSSQSTTKIKGESKLNSTTVKPVTANDDLSNDDDEEDLDREIVVCCTDLFSVKEAAHPTDQSKKITSLSLVSPVSPHHLGWAVGPFEQIPLDSLEEESDEEDDEEKDTTAVRGFIYCLKDDKIWAINTCVILSRAIEYYSREFGSFPFSSYSVVFVNDAPDNAYSFSGLTVHSDRLLYGPEVIDPLFDSTELIASALSKQWSGVNVLPRNYDDIWITIGISLYMTNQFISKLMGFNEFKFRIKKRAEMICDQDIGKRPIADPYINFPINENRDFEFIKLKAPIVLFILNRRMTKTDKSFGLSRVIPKLFLEAMSGDLPNGGIDTFHFQHITEKVNHNKLESFFRQWVYGSGTPIFRITQRFNRKRMFIEMGIRQVQADELTPLSPTAETFVDSASSYLNDPAPVGIQNVFTGPMTIRIHEADGTPYEHIVNLKDNFTKLDIQYNTKYRRLKRRPKVKDDDEESADKKHFNDGENGSAGHLHDGSDNERDDDDGGNTAVNTNANTGHDGEMLAHCLGDILQSDDDIKRWGLPEWSKEEEEKMANEAFEWIRVDADFEWICKIYINQADYMFLSQLQQDRDVEAQYESLRYYAETPNPAPVYSSILLRTLMDSRYYYGIRIEAARALLSYAKRELDYLGMNLLIKAFQELFCFDTRSDIPLPNDFSDFQLYFIQKAIPSILAQVRDENGECPARVKSFLLDLLRYNENGQNQFADSFYVATLIEALVVAISDSKSYGTSHAVGSGANGGDVQMVQNEQFLNKLLLELDRCMRMDDWIPSYHRLISVVILQQKIKLALHGKTELSYEDLLIYTKPTFHDDIRVAAFAGILQLGGMKNALFLNYMFKVLELDASQYVKDRLLTKISEAIGVAGTLGTLSILDDEEFEPEELADEDLAVALGGANGNGAGNGSGANGLKAPLYSSSSSTMIVVEEDTSAGLHARKEAIDRTTIEGIIKLLRRDYGAKGKGLQNEFWRALQSPLLGIKFKKMLFSLSDVLFEPVSSLRVSLPIPRDKMITSKHMGHGKITIFRQNKFKIQFNKKIALKILTKMNNDSTAGAKSPGAKSPSVKSPAGTAGTASASAPGASAETTVKAAPKTAPKAVGVTKTTKTAKAAKAPVAVKSPSIKLSSKSLPSATEKSAGAGAAGASKPTAPKTATVAGTAGKAPASKAIKNITVKNQDPDDDFKLVDIVPMSEYVGTTSKYEDINIKGGGDGTKKKNYVARVGKSSASSLKTIVVINSRDKKPIPTNAAKKPAASTAVGVTTNKLTVSNVNSPAKGKKAHVVVKKESKKDLFGKSKVYNMGSKKGPRGPSHVVKIKLAKNFNERLDAFNKAKAKDKEALKKLKSRKAGGSAASKFQPEIKKSESPSSASTSAQVSGGGGLRYVKIKLSSRKVVLSSDPFKELIVNRSGNSGANAAAIGSGSGSSSGTSNGNGAAGTKRSYHHVSKIGKVKKEDAGNKKIPAAEQGPARKKMQKLRIPRTNGGDNVNVSKRPGELKKLGHSSASSSSSSSPGPSTSRPAGAAPGMLTPGRPGLGSFSSSSSSSSSSKKPAPGIKRQGLEGHSRKPSSDLKKPTNSNSSNGSDDKKPGELKKPKLKFKLKPKPKS